MLKLKCLDYFPHNAPVSNSIKIHSAILEFYCACGRTDSDFHGSTTRKGTHAIVGRILNLKKDNIILFLFIKV
jgi:hypothetical protein